MTEIDALFNWMQSERDDTITENVVVTVCCLMSWYEDQLKSRGPAAEDARHALGVLRTERDHDNSGLNEAFERHFEEALQLHRVAENQTRAQPLELQTMSAKMTILFKSWMVRSHSLMANLKTQTSGSQRQSPEIEGKTEEPNLTSTGNSPRMQRETPAGGPTSEEDLSEGETSDSESSSDHSGSDPESGQQTNPQVIVKTETPDDETAPNLAEEAQDEEMEQEGQCSN